MINRTLIRIRIIQIAYSHFLVGHGSVLSAERQLLAGLKKSYDLYFYILLLFVSMEDAYRKRIELDKQKWLRSNGSDNHPLLDNKFIAQLRDNKLFNDYLSENPMSWEDYPLFVRRMIDELLASDFYAEYCEKEHPEYEDDKLLWRNFLKKIFIRDDELFDILEEKSIYWNDDIVIVASFINKTIKKFSEEEGVNQELMPMFKDDEDRQFGIKLLDKTIEEDQKYTEMLKKYIDNWEMNRLALMDSVILKTALAEILNFPNIPTTVTINEYIDIAKAYSTQKSSSFINGILDSIISDLKNNNLLLKN